MKNFLKQNTLYLAWTTALLAMLVSLYFSEALKFAPCVLCWYQRVSMYPLVLILGIGIWKKDRNVSMYALPLAVIGWLISIYQNLLYYKVVPESLAPCVNGVSCTTRYIHYFGFVSIPLLSFFAFTVIISSLIIYQKNN